MIGRITKVRKRDGRLVDFDETKISDAIFKSACAVGDGDRFLAEELAGVVTLFLEKSYSGSVPGIEEIQDMVEKVLIETGHARMAKAYILYRERRARAREQVRVRAEGAAGPLVGSPAKALVSGWSKGRIAEALIREADLDPKVAEKVATLVEEKVFASGVQRITTAAIRSLVEAELFLQGYGDRVGRQALVGLPRYDVDRLVRGAKEAGWRPNGPRDLKRAVADAVLAQYALSEVYSSEVVDAHLDARLHVADAGCPFEWLAAVARVPARASDADTWVEAAALLAGRLSDLVTRELALTGLAASGRSWTGALGAARRLLAHSALRTLDPRGGRFRLVLALPLLDEDEASRELAEALVREHWARFRAGALEGLPELILHLAAGKVGEPEARRALLPALAASAETGRIRVVFDRDRPAPLVTPSYRIAAGEPPGPAALPVGGAVALNIAALALERPGAGEPALLEALDASIDLGLKALRQKRTFLAGLQGDPSSPLYRVASGPRRIVAGEAGVDLVHLVGLQEAARRLAKDPADATRLAGRLRSYGAVRVAGEGRKARLKACVASERDGEAARRFLAVDHRRFEGLVESDGYVDQVAYSLPPESDLAKVGALHDPLSEVLELRFARDQAPAPEALYDALRRLARDPRVGVVRLTPWPDRSVRAALADL
ncbi:MAG: ATP cone domain-containing protein [Planctomycetota bacterium]